MLQGLEPDCDLFFTLGSFKQDKSYETARNRI